MSELDPKYTFDSFVVGPANRLASAAARRAAESPGTSYNPLFLYSPSGLGKSHILGAIAHQVEQVEVVLNVRYQTLEGYLVELESALATGDGDRLRAEYQAVDLLLLDDVQFLAGQPEAQEMILATLDALTTAGSQIVLASDRPPVEINGLDARLVTRFSEGLIVDIAPPEFETRVAIIRKKVEALGQTLEPGVAEALAKVPFKNVRELGGALNRILAVQELEGRRLEATDVPGLVETGRVEEAPPRARDEALDSFLSEVSGALSEVVEAHEEPWRRGLREAAEAAEREGFVARKLRGLIASDHAPADWTEQLDAFRRSLERLREIDAELDRLRNPWPEAAATLVKDPERLAEAESFLLSVRERVRPFPSLAPGPSLAELADAFPTLALKAAEQLVSAERPQYNPLFFWSSQAGSTRALLAATGRTFREGFEQGTLAVTSVEAFSEDFIRALSEGVAGAWRERWWTVDLLMVDGVQALAETERAQDEFFHLFEALKRRGARVLLTADRPPSAIRGIDDRLRSRFEGGLVLEVESGVLPVGAEALVMEEPAAVTAPSAGSGWEGLARDMEAHAEGPSVSAGAHEGRAERPPVAEGADATWVPSRENVVWAWPRMENRLVEDLG
jgi:chromosomal replication initiation ATPase DnaA